MNKYIIYGFTALLALGFASCSDDDEILEPAVGVVDNKFAVPADATGPEADMRREFYKNTGTYLMFSDLLSHDYIGKDAFGDDVYKDEYIDFKYQLTSMYDVDPEFVFIEDLEDKELASTLIEEYILPHVEGSLKPFSVLPVQSLKVPKNGSWGSLIDAKVASCWRCLAVATKDWSEMNDAERKEYSREILVDIVKTKFTLRSEEAEQFMDMSYEYSGEMIIDYDENWDRSDMTIVYEMGFLDYSPDWWDDDYHYDEFLYASTDFNMFLNAVMTRDEADFMEEFGNYARIVTKYNLMKEAVRAFGYKF